MPEALAELRSRLAQIADLGRARALLGWDERTMMPPAAIGARAEQQATLAALIHERATDDELGRLLEEAAAETAEAAYESDEASIVRVARRDWEKARRIPTELRAEIARVSSRSEHAWAEARERSDYEAYLPHLREMLELTCRYADCLIGFEGCERRYDALLDDYEPGMRTRDLEPVMTRLRDSLVPLVRDLPEARPGGDGSCLHGRFPVSRQRELIRRLVEELPLPAGGWRLDETVHPFATTIGPGDVRITTRYDESYLGTAVWSAVHETGHCLYDAGFPRELDRTPLYSSVSLGFDESQSRLWENWVGRGRPYVNRLLGHLREAFPDQFGGVDPDTLYRDANRLERSLIRVEADELTYNLHVVLRFELELQLVEGGLDPADLPRAWADRMEAYLGLEVPDDASGAMQDVHWAGGAFGYFPTYSLGNLIAAQLFERAEAEIDGLDAKIEAADFAGLNAWLTERIYRVGGRFDSAEMIARTIGELDTAPLLRHLESKLADTRR